MLEYIDSHAHYDAEQFDPDREELLNRIHQGGVLKIVNMGCNLERSRLSVEYAEKFPFVYAAVGIHPEDVDGTPEDYLEQIKKWAVLPKTVAIGEIGLDYHYEGYDPELQKRIFEEQLDLAEELSLPVVIHSRDATEDCMNILRKRGKMNGVMHCFSGSAETAKQVLALGMNI
ncbi:MAG: TatD family hydrolase, partial [Oscillospiraceae bacterium]|nr:TatD family hydrolase [Oscillospiraceae bacterium]